MANISISQVYQKIPSATVRHYTRIANWVISNPLPLGSLGVIVEVDEATFGKSKYNKSAYREVDWETEHCFLFRCLSYSILISVSAVISVCIVIVSYLNYCIVNTK